MVPKRRNFTLLKQYHTYTQWRTKPSTLVQYRFVIVCETRCIQEARPGPHTNPRTSTQTSLCTSSHTSTLIIGYDLIASSSPGVERHFAPRHFTPWHFTPWRFTPRHFTPRHFTPRFLLCNSFVKTRDKMSQSATFYPATFYPSFLLYYLLNNEKDKMFYPSFLLCASYDSARGTMSHLNTSHELFTSGRQG